MMRHAQQRTVFALDRPKPIWQSKPLMLGILVFLMVVTWLELQPSSAEEIPTYKPIKTGFLGRGFTKRMLEQQQQDLLNQIRYMEYRTDQEKAKMELKRAMLAAGEEQLKGLKDRVDTENQARIKAQMTLAQKVTELHNCQKQIAEHQAALDICGPQLDSMITLLRQGNTQMGLTRAQLKQAAWDAYHEAVADSQTGPTTTEGAPGQKPQQQQASTQIFNNRQVGAARAHRVTVNGVS